MIDRRRQSGMSMVGIFCILLMLGFFALCAIRIAPPYFEYLSVKDIIERIVMDPVTKTASTASIRRKLATIFNTNQIYELSYKDVEIIHRKGKSYIDANYEVRLPIVWRVDAVIKFDDLLYEIGNPKPVSSLPPAKK
jgi:hypothetical protein